MSKSNTARIRKAAGVAGSVLWTGLVAAAAVEATRQQAVENALYPKAPAKTVQSTVTYCPNLSDEIMDRITPEPQTLSYKWDEGLDIGEYATMALAEARVPGLSGKWSILVKVLEDGYTVSAQRFVVYGSSSILFKD